MLASDDRPKILVLSLNRKTEFPLPKRQANGFDSNGMWCPLEEFALRSHQSTWQGRLQVCLGTRGVVPEGSTAHINLNSTTRPCRSHIHVFAVVQNSLQNCSVCQGIEIVDETLIVLIWLQYLCCQQGTLLIGETERLSCVYLFLRASHRTLTAVI